MPRLCSKQRDFLHTHAQIISFKKCGNIKHAQTTYSLRNLTFKICVPGTSKNELQVIWPLIPLCYGTSWLWASGILDLLFVGLNIISLGDQEPLRYKIATSNKHTSKLTNMSQITSLCFFIKTFTRKVKQCML